MSEAKDVATATPQSRQRTNIIVRDEVALWDTGAFEQMQRIASTMANSTLVPDRLLGDLQKGGGIGTKVAAANCFLVVNQAHDWRMNPFALAQHAYVEHGKIGYEGKVIMSVVQSSPQIDGYFDYQYSGEGELRKIVVSATRKGEKEPKTIDGTYKDWKTFEKDKVTVKAAWSKSPDQMLAYRGAREWARRWMPQLMLGVYADDELTEITLDRGQYTEAAAPPAPQRSEFLRPQEQSGAGTGAAPAKAGEQAGPAGDPRDQEEQGPGQGAPVETGKPAAQEAESLRFEMLLPNGDVQTFANPNQYAEKFVELIRADAGEKFWQENSVALPDLRSIGKVGIKLADNIHDVYKAWLARQDILKEQARADVHEKEQTSGSSTEQKPTPSTEEERKPVGFRAAMPTGAGGVRNIDTWLKNLQGLCDNATPETALLIEKANKEIIGTMTSPIKVKAKTMIESMKLRLKIPV